MSQNAYRNLSDVFKNTTTLVSQEVEVLSWSPDPIEKRTPPTQVHMVCTVFKFAKAAFIIHIKSRAFCQAIIDALQSHMDEVWPEDTHV